MRRICVVSGALALAALLAGAGGCAPFAWFVALFEQPVKVKAVFKPPKGKTMLVFVDNLSHWLDYEPVKGELTERLNKQLREHGIAAGTISHERLSEFIAATPRFNQLGVIEVGQRLGADIVLYVQIDKFSLKDDRVSPVWRGRFHVTVRVVDVKAGRIWPKGPGPGYVVPPVEIPARTDSSATYGAHLAKIMAGKMADRVAKLFYDHEVSADPKWSWEEEEE